jgi:MinD-like ATPase involved in chromosome partitioning or flagellar assembly
MNDQASRLREMMQIKKQGGVRFLTVTGASGPSGKSMIAYNLAAEFARSGHRALVLSLDEKAGGRKATLAYALEQDFPLSERMMVDRYGVGRMSGGSLAELTELGARLTCGGFAQLAQLAGLIIFDTKASDCRRMARLIGATREAILVVTPQQDPLLECYRLAREVRQREDGARLCFVLNKAAGEERSRQILENYVHVLERHLGRKPEALGWVPMDQQVSQADEMRKPLGEAFPGGAAAQHLERIAKQYMAIPGKGWAPFDYADIFG